MSLLFLPHPVPLPAAYLHFIGGPAMQFSVACLFFAFFCTIISAVFTRVESIQGYEESIPDGSSSSNNTGEYQQFGASTSGAAAPEEPVNAVDL